MNIFWINDHNLSLMPSTWTNTNQAMTRRSRRTTSEYLTRMIQLGSVALLFRDIRKLRCVKVFLLPWEVSSIRSDDARMQVAANVAITGRHTLRYVVSTITVNIRLECRLEICTMTIQYHCKLTLSALCGQQVGCIWYTATKVNSSLLEYTVCNLPQAWIIWSHNIK